MVEKMIALAILGSDPKQEIFFPREVSSSFSFKMSKSCKRSMAPDTGQTERNMAFNNEMDA